jgi:general secretion pathway protein K
VALITALLIVFLSSLLATELAWVQQLAIRRSTLLQHQQQARMYLLGAEQWAAAILLRDARAGETDHPGEEWATVLPALPVQGGGITGRIDDLQGRFNLNNLLRARTDEAAPDPDTGNPPPVGDASDRAGTPPPLPIGVAVDPKQFRVLQRLLDSLDIAPGVAQAIADWLDEDQDALFPDGAEDGIYVGYSPAYLAANRPLTSLSELRLVAGIDDETYAKLQPYVCALPPGTPLNVNTAPTPVLVAAGDGLGLRQAEDAAKTRGQKGYASVDDFLRAVEFGNEGLGRNHLSVGSRFFLLTAAAQVGDGRATLRSILERNGVDGVRVVRRSFGDDY